MAEGLTIAGGCHCGAVRFSINVSAHVEILDCNCSICSKTGFQHLIVAHKDFKLKSGFDDLTHYRFGTQTAEHLFCRKCGVKSYYQPRSHPDSWSVNLRCLDDVSELNINLRSFDGKNWNRARTELG